jgi:hypothetical protein
MFNIDKDAHGWKCTPPTGSAKKSAGVDFKNDAADGCTIRFRNSAVFGTSSVDVAAKTTKHLNFDPKANGGDSTGFKVCDLGTNCLDPIEVLDDPYTITISSTGAGRKGKKKPKKAAKPSAKKVKKPAKAKKAAKRTPAKKTRRSR